MSTHRIIFDLEEITNALIDLANTSISFSAKEEAKKLIANTDQLFYL